MTETPETLTRFADALWADGGNITRSSRDRLKDYASAWAIQLAEKQARIEALERREAVGDRIHDFLCKIFASPAFLADAFSKECWALMQDWTAPPALAGKEKPNDPA